jgi:hypothetical protein
MKGADIIFEGGLEVGLVFGPIYRTQIFEGGLEGGGDEFRTKI